MDLFPLHLFPQGSLASSVITTVWVGVFVIAALNLRFGWPLTGLVVPGYLVPLLMLKPWSVLAIYIEAVITYGIVWFLFELAPLLGGWSRLFGRDRFFALVLVSIVVRVFFDGWIFQQVGEYLVQNFYIQFDYRDNLHSFGLIIVILIANHFWKPGLEKGTMTLAAAVGLTYLIVRYVLLELTNFSISDLGYMYEELASSVLSGPKSYIILVTAAYIASRMNLRYGWDFSGILIPALIAMQWFQPIKILTSIGEAFVILLLARLILNAPIFRAASIEGARKILLFFNLGFLYKFALAYVILWLAPEVKVTDYFGFGYLLSTLIAIKMYDKGIAMRMARAVLQTSLVAFVLATVVGYALTMVPKPWVFRVPGAMAEKVKVEVEEETGVTLADRLRRDSLRLFRHWPQDSFVEPLPSQLELFTHAMEVVREAARTKDARLIADASTMLAKLGYRMVLLEGHYLYIYEPENVHGWGIFVVDMDRPKGLLIEVPAPVSERGAFDAGLALFLRLGGRALAIAGAPRKVNLNGTSDVTLNVNLFFQAFHKLFAARNVLQVRGYSLVNARALYGVRKLRSQIDLPSLPTKIWVARSLPPDLDLAVLKRMLSSYEIAWEVTPFRNIQRDYTRAGFAEIFLNAKDVRRLMGRFLLARSAIQLEVGEERIDGYLQDWLLTGKIRIAPRGSNLYVPPKQEQLLYLDHEVITPLLDIARSEFKDGKWSVEGLQELKAVASSASVLNYHVVRYHDKDTDKHYLILVEGSEGKRHYWGTYVFALQADNEAIIQVPRPLFEVSTFEYGVSLFARLGARALLIGGAHHEANQDRSSDLISLANISNVFNLVNQVVLRESGPKPMLVLQCRGFGAKPTVEELPEADVLIAFSDGVIDETGMTPVEREVYGMLQRDEMKVRIVDGGEETIGYEVGALPQALYLNQTRNKVFAVMWLSALTRFSYHQQNLNYVQAAQFRALGLPLISAELHEFLEERTWGDGRVLPQSLREDIVRYIQSQDIVALQNMVSRWPGYAFGRLLDINSRQAFLIVEADGRVQALVNLVPRSLKSEYIAVKNLYPKLVLERFIFTRAAWLRLQEEG